MDANQFTMEEKNIKVYSMTREWSDNTKDSAFIIKDGDSYYGQSLCEDHSMDSHPVSIDYFSTPLNTQEKSSIDYDWRSVSEGFCNETEVQSRTVHKPNFTIVKPRSNPFKQSDWLHKKIPVTNADTQIKNLPQVLNKNALNNLNSNGKLFGRAITNVKGNFHSVEPCGGFMFNGIFIRVNPFGELDYRDANQALVTLDDNSTVAIWKSPTTQIVYMIREFTYDNMKLRSPLLKLDISDFRTDDSSFHSDLEKNNPFVQEEHCNEKSHTCPDTYEDPFEDVVDEEALLQADPRRYVSFKLGAFTLRNKQSQLFHQSDTYKFLADKLNELGKFTEATNLKQKSIVLKHCATIFGIGAGSIEGAVDRIYRLNPRCEDGQRLAGVIVGGCIGNQISKLVIGVIEGNLKEKVNEIFSLKNLEKMLYGVAIGWLQAAGYSIADGIIQGAAKELLSEGMCKKIPQLGLLIGGCRIINNARNAKNLTQGTSIVVIGVVNVGISYGCTALGTYLIPVPFVGSMVGSAAGAVVNNMVSYGFQKATGINLDSSVKDYIPEVASAQITR